MRSKSGSIRTIAAICCGGGLLFHAYYYCYAAFAEWGFTSPVADRLARAFAGIELLSTREASKFAILALLAGMQAGGHASGMMPGIRSSVARLAAGLLVYFGSGWLLQLTGDPAALGSAYMLTMGVGLWLAYRALKPLTGWVVMR